MAGGGDRLPRDAVDLVEGVWPQQPVVRCPDEQLQREGLILQVAVELVREGKPAQRPARSGSARLVRAEASSGGKSGAAAQVGLSCSGPRFLASMKPGAWRGLRTPASWVLSTCGPAQACTHTCCHNHRVTGTQDSDGAQPAPTNLQAEPAPPSWSLTPPLQVHPSRRGEATLSPPGRGRPCCEDLAAVRPRRKAGPHPH